MAVETPEQLTTRLLTLLNVSATKNTKRKRWIEDEPPAKLNKRKHVRIADADGSVSKELESKSVTDDDQEDTPVNAVAGSAQEEEEGQADEEENGLERQRLETRYGRTDVCGS